MLKRSVSSAFGPSGWAFESWFMCFSEFHLFFSIFFACVFAYWTLMCAYHWFTLADCAPRVLMKRIASWALLSLLAWVWSFAMHVSEIPFEYSLSPWTRVFNTWLRHFWFYLNCCFFHIISYIPFISFMLKKSLKIVKCFNLIPIFFHEFVLISSFS